MGSIWKPFCIKKKCKHAANPAIYESRWSCRHFDAPSRLTHPDVEVIASGSIEIIAKTPIEIYGRFRISIKIECQSKN